MKKIPEELQLSPRRLLEMEDAEPSMFIVDIAKLFGKMANRDTPEESMSHGFRRMFRILCMHDGITQVELARAANLSSPSVSAALNRMEAEGLVKRVPDDTDRRKVFVYITEKGREQDDRVRVRCKEAERVMMRDIAPEEREQLISTLRKVLKNLLEEENL